MVASVVSPAPVEFHLEQINITSLLSMSAMTDIFTHALERSVFWFG